MDATLFNAGDGRRGGLGRLIFRRLDARLRRRHGIAEFSDDPSCMLRIARRGAPRTVTLADGTRVARGEPIIELHFWNERVPPFPPGGADVRWARETSRRFVRSLELLAAHVEADPDLSSAVALWAETPMVTRRNQAQFRRIVERLGLEVERPGRRTAAKWLHDLGNSLFMLGMLWTFNPQGVRRDGLLRRPLSVRMSRRALLRRYGPAGSAAA